MKNFPKIINVKPYAKNKLMVVFETGDAKIYDCSPLLKSDPFTSLKNNSLFANVSVSFGGYGIEWNDDIDLSESELWLNGKQIKKPNKAVPRTRQTRPRR